ncbi:ABC transporter ATP-binding protein [Methanobrevibacter sp.]|uniref:ABC transporter ATP-binding protein n=1 Tax=Methanobrevibacter sp. TaxID=66852 RepID=UPI0038685E86
MSIKDKLTKIIGNNDLNYTHDPNSDVAIKVEHLTMEFKSSHDKVDTLKEYLVRTIKRDKTGAKKVTILKDISFSINRGEKLGILGFNGAGKSTLLRIIAGIYEPTHGKITINGKIAPLLELNAGFDKNYTGKDNIYLNGALLSMDKEFIDEKYDEIVEYSELGDYINVPIKNYSKGMKAKLGFSIATLINPDILIIDEILSVGDIKFRKKSGETLNNMMADGVTVLLVSHSINQVRRICDKCIWIDNGELIMEGDVDEVCDAYVEDANYSKIKRERRIKKKLRKKYG